MGRKNRRQHHEHDSKPHHHEHDQYVGEIESSGEEIEIVEVVIVPEHISRTGRQLADYPVITAHETPAQREARRQATADAQLDNLDLSENDENLRIDRYRATHVPATRVGKPHEMIDDEITTKVSDFHTEKTPDGGRLASPLAHEKAGFKQGNAARHAAFKRRIGLPDDAECVSPVSGGQKK